MYKHFLNIFLLLSTVTLVSQNFKGAISEVNQDGFHKILLSPEVRSASASNTNYFRILDAKENEVPYVLLNDESSMQSSYSEFNFENVNNTKDSVTSIVIENKNKQKLDHFTLKIANTKVKKTYTISGSNDKKEWYGLATNQVFYGLNEAEKTTVEQTFSFPLTDYAFIKFDFNNKESLPLQILNVGVYKNQFSTVSQVEITDFKIKNTNNKKNKTTQLSVTFAMPQHIESMVFDIENEVFLREAKILVNKNRTIKKRIETYQENVFNFELHSGTHNTFELPYIFEKEIVIEIENNDNPPLNIKHLKFFQKPLYVICNLKKNEAYEAIIDTTLQKPIYDLVNFKASFNTDLPEAVITNFNKIDTQNKVSETKSFWQTNAFMWLCIILAILVISYFAFGLLKDLKKQN
ncbi:hypothetical protein EV196_102318 [Mariniflexile fucanivorans]|uniref:DUF3999 family protein n=1 Tax=Mariniflexile fucanivorans TaxID=264023 RepID=A0A4V6NGY1_9FLAO|nr:hypothetical protein [Mariniflexile fucanivorans]TCL67757.1 hypothetical protein EV196_102318 [Mariniflexile fucanivorans]